jgi:hypothetical protein
LYIQMFRIFTRVHVCMSETHHIWHAHETDSWEPIMVKRTLVGPLYVAVAWILLISYQSFTRVAVHSLALLLEDIMPQTTTHLILYLDQIVYIHTFAWIFLATSVIPSIILSRTKSTLLQFLLVLVLSFTGLYLVDSIADILGRNVTQEILNWGNSLKNPALAAIYLLTPYISMLIIDLYTRRRSHRKQESKTIASVSS